MSGRNTTEQVERLARIHVKTDGRCHLCGRRRSLRSYGKTWEIDHSKARRMNGSNRIANLFVACILCNRSKGIRSSQSFRREMGLARRPLSNAEAMHTRLTQSLIGGTAAGFISFAFRSRNSLKFFALGALAGFALDPEWNHRL